MPPPHNRTLTVEADEHRPPVVVVIGCAVLALGPPHEEPVLPGAGGVGGSPGVGLPQVDAGEAEGRGRGGGGGRVLLELGARGTHQLHVGRERLEVVVAVGVAVRVAVVVVDAWVVVVGVAVGRVDVLLVPLQYYSKYIETQYYNIEFSAILGLRLLEDAGGSSPWTGPWHPGTRGRTGSGRGSRDR